MMWAAREHTVRVMLVLRDLCRDGGKIGEVARKRRVDLITGESRTPRLSLASNLYDGICLN